MDMPHHLLIVDDDIEIRQLLGVYLEKNGYRATAVGDGRAMWTVLEKKRVDLVVLDLMLPGDDGLTLCRELRARSAVPIIMLTARGEETDRILGLEMGADDYLPKPFSPRELLARIKAVLRRVPEPLSEPVDAAERLRFSGWTLDTTVRHLVDPDGVVVFLSSGEYRLLRLFLEHPRRVMSRDRLMELLAGRDWDPMERSIDVQVSRLRRRLREDAKVPKLIKTVRGAGYILAARVERA